MIKNLIFLSLFVCLFVFCFCFALFLGRSNWQSDAISHFLIMCGPAKGPSNTCRLSQSLTYDKHLTIGRRKKKKERHSVSSRKSGAASRSSYTGVQSSYSTNSNRSYDSRLHASVPTATFTRQYKYIFVQSDHTPNTLGWISTQREEGKKKSPQMPNTLTTFQNRVVKLSQWQTSSKPFRHHMGKFLPAEAGKQSSCKN